MAYHKYEIKPGFIGPLTERRTRVREYNRNRNKQRSEEKRISNLCLDRTNNHDFESWDCGCMYFCDCCKFNKQCKICKKLF